MTEQLYDAIAVSIKDARVKWVDAGKTKANAEAIVKMAVMRQGVNECFFVVEETGRYQAGDEYPRREEGE